jgi:hypothetical protein
MNKKENKDNFDTVKFFRKIKEKIADETKNMTFAEFKKYMSERKMKVVK